MMTPPTGSIDERSSSLRSGNGGEPFFPIVIYAVSPRDFNPYDFDRAMADLKAVGFNLVHSYADGTSPAMLAASKRNGMRQWTIVLPVAAGTFFEDDFRAFCVHVYAWSETADVSGRRMPIMVK